MAAIAPEITGPGRILPEDPEIGASRIPTAPKSLLQSVEGFLHDGGALVVVLHHVIQGVGQLHINLKSLHEMHASEGTNILRFVEIKYKFRRRR